MNHTRTETFEGIIFFFYCFLYEKGRNLKDPTGLIGRPCEKRHREILIDNRSLLPTYAPIALHFNQDGTVGVLRKLFFRWRYNSSGALNPGEAVIIVRFRVL